ncbi:MAG: class I SAM-dependent methyltransferase, partial [Candidatus Omnitrophica bacterium]|nr:class I SAM-dependent methyltransferase [Candidatus Omnitrophota bacterium]
YFSLRPLQSFFKRHGMQVVDVKRVATKGGSLRVMVKRSEAAKHISPAVRDLAIQEEKAGISRLETFSDFGAKLNNIKEKLQALVKEIKASGKQLAGYGASVGVTTLIYELGLGKSLDYIVDDNPVKQNLFSPGFHLPVFASSLIYEKKPEYLLVLAWGYSAQIMKKHEQFLRDGGKFILPLPGVKVIERQN